MRRRTMEPKLYSSIEEMESDMTTTLIGLMPNAYDRDALFNQVPVMPRNSVSRALFSPHGQAARKIRGK
jgi:hypothetical protein